MRVLVGALVLLGLVACSDDAPEQGRGPGLAVEGSIDTGFTVRLYRFEGDVTVQLHPRGGDALLRVPGAAEVCADQVCTLFVEGQASVDFDGGDGHRTLRIRSEARVEEATIAYDPADNFLAVDFHR